MHYQLYDIHPLLKPYVKTICVMDSDESEASLVPMRVLPDACVELFVNFYEPQQVAAPGAPSAHGRSFLTSRMNTFMDVQTRGRVGFVSVCFTDGFAYPFFPLSMHHVANHVIDLRDVWGIVQMHYRHWLRVPELLTSGFNLCNSI
ncbi:DUF6597 domain-containing transcriptional factor [Spirosoma sp. KNUC1025]|uniref:DUF6597 domain-containing transcriptional factor n=1 Tax=Spirosoma sp. KNUC1025 TaxID=2894082 RepID=UPI00386CF08B